MTPSGKTNLSFCEYSVVFREILSLLTLKFLQIHLFFFSPATKPQALHLASRLTY